MKPKEEMTPAQIKGRNVARNNVLPYCPFPEGSPERLEWLRGFAVHSHEVYEAERFAQQPPEKVRAGRVPRFEPGRGLHVDPEPVEDVEPEPDVDSDLEPPLGVRPAKPKQPQRGRGRRELS